VDRAALETIKRSHGSRGGRTTRLALQFAQLDSFSPKAPRLLKNSPLPCIDQLQVQTPTPAQSFRQSRFLSAVDFVQAGSLPPQSSARNGALSRSWTCSWSPRCATKCSLSATRPATVAYTARRIRPSRRARSDWGPRPKNPLPKFSAAAPRPHGITLIGPPLRGRAPSPHRHRPRTRLRR